MNKATVTRTNNKLFPVSIPIATVCDGKGWAEQETEDKAIAIPSREERDMYNAAKEEARLEQLFFELKTEKPDIPAPIKHTGRRLGTFKVNSVIVEGKRIKVN